MATSQGRPTGQARPTGITILAILAGLQAIGGLFGGFVAIGAGTLLFGVSGTTFGIAWLALAAMYLALAWGLWTMAPWAWPLGVALAAVSIIYALVLAIFGGQGIASAIIPVVVGGAILYYLNQPTIKSLFGRA